MLRDSGIQMTQEPDHSAMGAESLGYDNLLFPFACILSGVAAAAVAALAERAIANNKQVQ